MMNKVMEIPPFTRLRRVIEYIQECFSNEIKQGDVYV